MNICYIYKEIYTTYDVTGMNYVTRNTTPIFDLSLIKCGLCTANLSDIATMLHGHKDVTFFPYIYAKIQPLAMSIAPNFQIDLIKHYQTEASIADQKHLTYISNISLNKYDYHIANIAHISNKSNGHIDMTHVHIYSKTPTATFQMFFPNTRQKQILPPKLGI